MLFFKKPEPYLRRVMIIISDGQDHQRGHTREEALAMVQRAEVTVFTISTNRTGWERGGQSPAAAGGGNRGPCLLSLRGR